MAMMVLVTLTSCFSANRYPPESPVYELNFPSKRPVVDVEGHDRLRLIIDSGAHSGCMSSDKLHLVKVTNSNPNRRVKVAMEHC